MQLHEFNQQFVVTETGEKIVVYITSYESGQIFLEMAEEFGFKVENLKGYRLGYPTCICLNFTTQSTYCSLEYAEAHPCVIKVVKFSQSKNFDKKHLRSDDVVWLENGAKLSYLKTTNTLHCGDGQPYGRLSNYNKDLESHTNRGRDISQIFRNGELLWERPKKTAKDMEIERIQSEIKILENALEKVKASE